MKKSKFFVYFKKVIKAFTHPRLLCIYFLVQNSQLIKNDVLYLKIIFRLCVGYKLNLKSPKTFNEKLNWLKLYYRKPEFAIMADKYRVKKYVAERIGEEFVVPNYGVWNSFDEIDFSVLPNQFVLKTTNDSLGTILCRDKSNFDYEKAKKHIETGLRRNYYYIWREFGYRDVPRRVIADKYLDDGNGAQLLDYKFWCFNGVPKYMYCTIKGDGVFENFYDMEFNPIDINHGFPRHQPEFEKPKRFELMKELASKLSNGLPFVRVDFFYVNNHVYFGEFTFYDWAGIKPFNDIEWDKKLGDDIVLPI